jgi:hypothetical protein
MMKESEQLKKELYCLKQEMRILSRKILEAEAKESDVRIGQIYKMKGPMGREYRGKVVCFTSVFGETRPVITLYKSDGTLGIKNKTMLNYENWVLEE